MSTVQTEQVMVVKTELFHELGCFQGFCSEPETYLDVLLDPANTQYLPRDEMEQDPSFKQLIPYCIFECEIDGANHVFQYTRGSGAGESRLRSKKSVGIGGHISTLDADDESPYLVGMQRELDEEIVIETPYDQSLVGLINDDSNEVGKVHLGIVHRYLVTTPDIRSREDDIANAGFRAVAEVLDELESFETWSQICLTSLYR
ncbi:MAG: phosphoesterase [Planctomycetota bacterium]